MKWVKSDKDDDILANINKSIAANSLQMRKIEAHPKKGKEEDLCNFGG